jgi:hypothetical protein
MQRLGSNWMTRNLGRSWRRRFGVLEKNKGEGKAKEIEGKGIGLGYWKMKAKRKEGKGGKEKAKEGKDKKRTTSLRKSEICTDLDVPSTKLTKGSNIGSGL